MATFDNNLRLKEINTGDEAGTWGNSTNLNLELIADAFGYGTKQLAADADETFTMPDSAADGTRSLLMEITSAVSLTTTRTVTLGPNTVSKFWIIKNSTTGGQSIEIAQGTGGTVTIANGDSVFVYTDGGGIGAAVVNAGDSLAFTSLSVGGNPVVTNNRNLVAGAGLTGGGTLAADRTFNVGAGTGISVAADNVGLDTANTRNVDHAAVTFTAGAGLTGGGTLAADRTFSVGAGNGISVAADSVAINSAWVNSQAWNFSSAISFANGSAAAPSIRFGSDTDTGLFRAASDALGLSTGGSERVRVNSSGDIGIGTTSPDRRLVVAGDASFGEYVMIRTADNTNASAPGQFAAERSRGTVASPAAVNNNDTLLRIRARGYDGADYEDSAAIEMAVDGTPSLGTDMPGRITFLTTADGSDSFTERMRITSDGRVGINVTAPDASLHASGGSGTTELKAENTDAAGANSYAQFAAETTVGELFVGATGPGRATGAGTVYHGNEAYVATDANLEALNIAAANSSGVIKFFTGGTSAERMRITSAGNVGIGTASPADILSVQGGTGSSAVPSASLSSDETIDLRIYGTGFAGSLFGVSRGDLGALVGRNGVSGLGVGTLGAAPLILGTNNTDRVYIASSGDVGIGTTSPDAPLHVARAGLSQAMLEWTGNLNDSGEVDRGFFRFGARNFNGTQRDWGIRGFTENMNAGFSAGLRFQTVNGSSQESMRIAPNGNVGIGTTNPITLLHVFPSGTSSDVQVRVEGGDSGGTSATLNLVARNSAFKEAQIRSAAGSSGNGGIMEFWTDNTSGAVQRAMVIDSSQRVGIGTTSPDERLHVNGNVKIGNSTSTAQHIEFESANPMRIRYARSGSTREINFFDTTDSEEGWGVFYNGFTWNMGVAVPFNATPGNGQTGVRISDTGLINAWSNSNALALGRTTSGGNGSVAIFQRGTSGTVGSISVTTTSTSYNTSSDARLKENVGGFDGLTMLGAMRPVRFDWKADGSEGFGVLAQELESVLPQAVSTAEDEEALKSVDYSKIVPILMKAIQELEERVEELEANLDAA